MLKFMQPISATRMIELKKEIVDLKRRLKKCNDDGEVRKLKKRISEKQTHYNILAEKLRGHV